MRVMPTVKNSICRVDNEKKKKCKDTRSREEATAVPGGCDI